MMSEQDTKHHPASVDLELVKRLVASTKCISLQKFLVNEFSAISKDLAGSLSDMQASRLDQLAKARCMWSLPCRDGVKTNVECVDCTCLRDARSRDRHVHISALPTGASLNFGNVCENAEGKPC